MFGTVQHWEWVSVAFFAYALVCALALRELRVAARSWCVTLSLLGAIVAALSARLRETPVLHDWVLPPVVLFLA